MPLAASFNTALQAFLSRPLVAKYFLSNEESQSYYSGLADPTDCRYRVYFCIVACSKYGNEFAECNPVVLDPEFNHPLIRYVDLAGLITEISARDKNALSAFWMALHSLFANAMQDHIANDDHYAYIINACDHFILTGELQEDYDALSPDMKTLYRVLIYNKQKERAQHLREQYGQADAPEIDQQNSEGVDPSFMSDILDSFTQEDVEELKAKFTKEGFASTRIGSVLKALLEQMDQYCAASGVTRLFVFSSIMSEIKSGFSVETCQSTLPQIVLLLKNNMNADGTSSMGPSVMLEIVHLILSIAPAESISRAIMMNMAQHAIPAYFEMCNYTDTTAIIEEVCELLPAKHAAIVHKLLATMKEAKEAGDDQQKKEQVGDTLTELAKTIFNTKRLDPEWVDLLNTCSECLSPDVLWSREVVDRIGKKAQIAFNKWVVRKAGGDMQKYNPANMNNPRNRHYAGMRR